MATFEPTIHFVSGFLGSGKTTAIVGICKALQEEGFRTAIVTNDQGRYQVDQAFVSASGIPSVAVSNGCLCCRYDDFEERVLSLAEQEKPQVIFAESVGSCADVVATVVKPFAAFRGEHQPPGSLSTFVDARMLEARLGERRLPFSDGVLYIFDKQIEEAELLVINKRDLLSGARAEALRAQAQARFPDKQVLLHSAFEERDLRRWYEAAQNCTTTRGKELRSLEEMDYELYAAGERNLAWLDVTGTVVADSSGAQGDVHGATSALIVDFASRLLSASAPIGHLKVVLSHSEGKTTKVSLTDVDSATTAEIRESVERQLPQHRSLPVEILLNARVMCDVETLQRLFNEAVEELARERGVRLETRREDAFLPGYPRPIHRL